MCDSWWEVMFSISSTRLVIFCKSWRRSAMATVSPAERVSLMSATMCKSCRLRLFCWAAAGEEIDSYPRDIGIAYLLWDGLWGRWVGRGHAGSLCMKDLRELEAKLCVSILWDHEWEEDRLQFDFPMVWSKKISAGAAEVTRSARALGLSSHLGPSSTGIFIMCSVHEV